VLDDLFGVPIIKISFSFNSAQMKMTAGLSDMENGREKDMFVLVTKMAAVAAASAANVRKTLKWLFI
jgi:uncharacterized protein YcsI (UPF0317 family)